jgi:hypothetical protein
MREIGICSIIEECIEREEFDMKLKKSLAYKEVSVNN